MSVTVDKWFIEDIIDTVSKTPKKKKRIVIPKFQRKRVWNETKENDLIDSIQKNFPVSNLTLYKVCTRKDIDEYILIDGLQRTITLLKYVNNPLSFSLIQKKIKNIVFQGTKKFDRYSLNNITHIFEKWFSIEYLKSYVFIVKKEYAKKVVTLKNLITDILKEEIKVRVKNDVDSIVEYILEKTNDLSNFINISTHMIPITIIHCDENDLYKVYERLNTSGTPLKKFEVLAATWFKHSKNIKILSKNIVDNIDEYYNKELKHTDDFDLHIHDEDKIGFNKMYNCFEYIIGLHKFLAKKSMLLLNKYGNDYEFTFKLISTINSKSMNLFDSIPTFIESIENYKTFETNIAKSVVFCDNVFKDILWYMEGNNTKFYFGI